MYLMESKALLVKSGIRLSNTVLVILANKKGKEIVVDKEKDILRLFADDQLHLRAKKINGQLSHTSKKV